ncbi:WW domain-containing oxidoreductase [Verticillium dahliae]
MSRYEAAHLKPAGPGDARPTALQIIEDEGATGKLKGKIIVVTGVSAGLGIETVRALERTGASFYLLARDLAKAEKALADFFDPARMELVQMDLGSLASVRQAANTILAKTGKINILVNNPGIMAVPDLRFTEDGHELQFGTNHLAHFLFFELLKPALLAGVTDDFHSRVVNVASMGHLMGGINASDNYDYKNGGYTPYAAYAQSKTANIYMASEIERRYGRRGLHATSLHPGVIMTELVRFMTTEQLAEYGTEEERLKFKSPEQGAATTVWAAIGQEWATKGGKYLLDCSVAKAAPADLQGLGPYFVAHTYDPENEARLWRDSLKLVGLEETQ